MRGRTRIMALALAGMFPLLLVPHARALNGDSGSCVLNVTITFSGTHKLQFGTGSPNYSVRVTGGDLDLATGGDQACAYSLGGLSPDRTTSVSASPTFEDSDLLSCEAVHATGTWTQAWYQTPPVDVDDMIYQLTGTWGHWKMAIKDPALVPGFVATVDLTFANPLDEATKAPLCNSTAGVGTLNLTGVEVFQFP